MEKEDEGQGGKEMERENEVNRERGIRGWGSGRDTQ